MRTASLLALLLAAPAWAQGAATPSQGWTDSLATFINDPLISGLLLTVGFLCLFPALATLGSTLVLESLSLTCFGLFFWARFHVGAAEGLPLFIFAFGVVLLGVEVLIVPGMMKPGFLGSLAVAAGIIMSFSDLHTGLLALGGAVGGGLVGLAAMIKFLPQNKTFRKHLVLEPPQTKEAEPDFPAPAVGTVGVAATPLRPAGYVEFDGQRVDVVSEGEFIDRGRYVQVARIEGHRVVVRPAPAQTWTGPPQS